MSYNMSAHFLGYPPSCWAEVVEEDFVRAGYHFDIWLHVVKQMPLTLSVLFSQKLKHVILFFQPFKCSK